jgi:lipid-binding SYLF domain-containing protein
VAGDADFVVFMRSKGLAAGGSVNGSVVDPAEKLNNAHYGKEVTPIDIVVTGSVKPMKTDAPLLSSVAK